MEIKSYISANPQGFHKIVYTRWGARSEVPVICVHGLTRNGRDFDFLASALSKERRVYCPDMPGRGKSDDLPNPLYYNFTQYMSDITALIARTGATQVDWVGTSMGGVIGMFLAALPNSPIRSLVLNDVGGFIPKGALLRIASTKKPPESFKNEKEVEAYIRESCRGFGKLSKKEWAHLAKYSVKKDESGKLVMAYDPRLADVLQTPMDADLWAFYDKITCPTLVIHGKHSKLLTNETAKEMTQRGPKAEIYEVADAGHAPALMAKNQIEKITSFFQKIEEKANKEPYRHSFYETYLRKYIERAQLFSTSVEKEDEE